MWQLKNMIKIISVVGARPNFMKIAPLKRAFDSREQIEAIIVHTGQHYDAQLSDLFFKELNLPMPKYNLGIGSGRPAWQMGMMMLKLDEVVEKETPDMIIVYGDTNSTAAGAIVAAKNDLPLIHIEAGLREFDRRIPEEVNKLLTDAVADYYFSPTQTGVDNLKKVGITHNVYNTGDVGIDLIYQNLEKIKQNTAILEKHHLSQKGYYFMTCHRANNTDKVENLRAILSLFKQLDLPVIFPMHPRTKAAIERHGLQKMLDAPNLILSPPIGFWDTQTLVRFAKAVITDSGGIIKESYFHRTPGVIIDGQTEWIETVEEGWNTIAGPNTKKVLYFLANLPVPSHHSNCLGDGTAAQQIVNIIKNHQYVK